MKTSEKELPTTQPEPTAGMETSKVGDVEHKRKPNRLYEEAEAYNGQKHDEIYDVPTQAENLDGLLVDPMNPPEDDDRPLKIISDKTTISPTTPQNVKRLAYLIEHGLLGKKPKEKSRRIKPVHKGGFRIRHVEDSTFPLRGESVDPADLQKMAQVAHKAQEKRKGT